LYKSKIYKKKWYKYLASAMGVTVLVALGMGAYSVSGLIGGTTGRYISLPILLGIGGYLAYRLWKNYTVKDLDDVSHDFKLWYKLFFWAIITHPILDCFTTYGTQLFAPFSNYRVSFNNISVADPVYTLPFIICLLTASFLPRLHPRRNLINWIGIAVSSFYMMFTIANKFWVNHILEETLQEQDIAYTRYMTNPTILNNVLWTGTVETDSMYYQGQYSLFDKEKRFKLRAIPKNMDLIEGHDHDETVETLKWFANNYVSIIRRSDGRLQINDMRYGTVGSLRNEEDKYIFSFILEPDEHGKYQLTQGQGGRPDPEERVELINDLVERARGI
jgi:inner membrane protein